MLFREDVINVRISYYGRRVLVLFLLLWVNQLTFNSSEREVMSSMTSLSEKKKKLSTTQSEKTDRKGSSRHRLKAGIADKVTSKYKEKQKLRLNKWSPLCSEIQSETNSTILYSNGTQKEISQL